VASVAATFSHLPHDYLHDTVLCDDDGLAVLRRAQALGVFTQMATLYGAARDQAKLVRTRQRFVEVVEGPELHGSTAPATVPCAGEHHHLGFGRFPRAPCAEETFRPARAF